MPRTRRSICNQENIIEPPKVTRRLRKRKNSESDEESEELSPTKRSTKSESLSPTITKHLNEKLNLSPKPASKIGKARRALADNSNFRLPGREAQFDELTSFLNELINKKTSASLYINGPPGK